MRWLYLCAADKMNDYEEVFMSRYFWMFSSMEDEQKVEKSRLDVLVVLHFEKFGELQLSQVKVEKSIRLRGFS